MKIDPRILRQIACFVLVVEFVGRAALADSPDPPRTESGDADTGLPSGPSLPPFSLDLLAPIAPAAASIDDVTPAQLVAGPASPGPVPAQAAPASPPSVATTSPVSAPPRAGFGAFASRFSRG